MSDDFNCEFADVCDFVVSQILVDATSGCVNDTDCLFYKEVKV